MISPLFFPARQRRNDRLEGEYELNYPALEPALCLSVCLSVCLSLSVSLSLSLSLSVSLSLLLCPFARRKANGSKLHFKNKKDNKHLSFFYHWLAISLFRPSPGSEGYHALWHHNTQLAPSPSGRSSVLLLYWEATPTSC